MNVEKLKKAAYQGVLELNGFKLTCAVLDDDSRTRVFAERTIANAFGIKGGGQYWQKKKEMEILLPEYLSAAYLRPYISPSLEEYFRKELTYITLNNQQARGVDVMVLPEICDVYIRAAQNLDNDNIKAAAKIAYHLMKGFATVGIVALVDEATGYQHEREQDELQKILKAYIAEELLPWQKRFPDIYYKELFRLNGWDYTISGIKKRPGVIGKWTNTLIYEQLPQGVLEELKKRTPKSDTGNYTARLHQSLTIDVGEPSLNNQINQVITLFQLSDNMKHMWQQFKKLKERQKGQLELQFDFDEEGHTKE